MPRTLQRTVIGTPLGSVVLWRFPEPPRAQRPVLVALSGALAGANSVAGLPERLDDAFHVAVGEVPTRGAEGVPAATITRMAQALQIALHRSFRDRPVVLMGVGDAAIVALAARAPEIVKVIAVEPPLVSSSFAALAPVVDAAVAGADEAVRRHLLDVYGRSAAGAEDRDHRPLFEAAPWPVEVVVGERTAGSPDAPGSVVSAAERAWLGTRGNVSLCVAAGAGGAVLREAASFLLGRLRQAGAPSPRPLETRPEPAVADALANAAPLTARRVLYHGRSAADFAAVYAARNPAAAVLGPQEAASADLLVIETPPHDDVLVQLVSRLDPGGTVVALASLGPPAFTIAERLQALGLCRLHADPELAPAGTALIRARKSEACAPARVDMVVYASRLMDIRTRLPAAGLRAEPDLEFTATPPPFRLPAQSGGQSKVLIMQRPGYWSSERWREIAARAILAETVIVLEYDDHPDLASIHNRGRPQSADEWERFRLAHAVQTSTEPLRALFSRYNPDVALFPNAAFSLAPFAAGPREPRVFYGGLSRGPFAVEVVASLGPAVAARPDVHFEVVGDRAVFEAAPTERKTFHDYLPYDRYLELMASCAVSLSPVAAADLAATKSDAKYLDGARAGVVTIGSACVYDQAIRHGENGLIAGELSDWAPMLTRILTDDVGRERMARAAWEDVRSHRMFAFQVAERRDWYRGLLARRRELDAALIARAPEVGELVARLRAATS